MESNWEGRRETLKWALRALPCDVTSCSPCKTLQKSEFIFTGIWLVDFGNMMVCWVQKRSRKKIATNQIPGGEAKSSVPRQGCLPHSVHSFCCLYHQNLNLVQGRKCLCAKHLTPQVSLLMVKSYDSLWPVGCNLQFTGWDLQKSGYFSLFLCRWG